MSETAEKYLPKVREQYEEFPYPERNPEDERKGFRAPYISRLDAVNHHCFKGMQNFKNFRVLVAGGGTGDALIGWAEQLRDMEGSSVVYLDMSKASTEIAKKRAKIRKLNNITWITDSLLNVPDLKLGRFDFIECNGVLHHLADPDAGLKALASALQPNGAMGLMVYGSYGRTGVYMIQKLMHLVNGDEENPRKKINNTKKMLEMLPPHHWFIVSQSLGWGYPDLKNNAGIYDLFLHSQDRAFTILEIHDWLERCGLKMTSEPGACNGQLRYLPETYIKDKNILAMIKQYPLKVQQAIAEAMSTQISTHDFYAVNAKAEETVAKITDTSLVPWAGMYSPTSFERMAAVSIQQRGDSVTIQPSNLPPHTWVFLPAGKLIAGILCKIDGQRTVAEIVSSIRNDPRYGDSPPAEEEIMREFGELFTSLNRAAQAFLRHKSVEPFMSCLDMQKRIENR
ncbi:MAG: class I SAM-dependent methyltransferase [Proteobacteria bacterium]|nr:class I SAM-dependent methyltransferase [Pseudomonadota bacterium]